MIKVPPNFTKIISTEETYASTSKKRGEAIRYYREDLEEAVNLIKEEKIWTVKNKTINKIYYRCNLQSKRSKPSCSATIYIHNHKNSNKVSIYRTTRK